MNYYVYRFKNELNEIIYIGKTINIDKRMKTHFSRGHLPHECYAEVSKIEYMKCKFEAEMNIKEIYYINKYKPRYNELALYNEERYIINELENDVWNYTFKKAINNNAIKEKIGKRIKINNTKQINHYSQIAILIQRFLKSDEKCFVHLNKDRHDEFLRMITNVGLDKDRIFITNEIKEVKIIDKSYKMVILNVSKENLIEKYSKLIPHDIDLFVTRNKKTIIPDLEILLDEKYLNKWILRDEIVELMKVYNIKDGTGDPIGFIGFKKIISNSGYGVKSKVKRNNTIKHTYYYISK